MKAFLLSDAGKATLGVFVACLCLVSPLAASWLVAGYTLAHAIRHFRVAFDRLDDIEPDATPALAVPLTAEAPTCDVGAVVAALAADSPRPNGRPR